MASNYESFYPSNRKRQILVVDDEEINRQVMGFILSDEFDVIYAENGQEAIEVCRARHQTLSLVLMDLMMPVLSGTEALRQMKADPVLRDMPVIVITADQQAEVECLELGAIDFIPKPYPQAGVILARIRRTIELYEDRSIITSTEKDPLTGLYNREFFFRYCEQFDRYHPDAVMDAVWIDINHFRMINERFGTVYGDKVLQKAASVIDQMASENGGLSARSEADAFLVYRPHEENYGPVLKQMTDALKNELESNIQVRLRMGVYQSVDSWMDIERRFDRAKMASDMVRGNFAKSVGLYDSAMHEKEIYAEQLIEGFRSAIEQDQFTVYYQPKFKIQTPEPMLASCEALVRWQHPTLGMISPGVFIPLFENNGLIQELDLYVWKKAAEQIRLWKEKLDYRLPISVNVSRIDMYDPNLPNLLTQILKENQLGYEDLLLEITESAYTQDSVQIVQMAERLRRLGFQIEMDDFGTGYSSLNMLSDLPIDVLKLDMQFVRKAFAENGDTKMVEVILGIAEYLSVPVIAEGVETEHQMESLKALGCDMVQGYFFSKPIPSLEFEDFILRDKAKRNAGAKTEEASAEDNTTVLLKPLASQNKKAFIGQEKAEKQQSFTPEGETVKLNPADVKEHISFYEKARRSMEEGSDSNLIPSGEETVKPARAMQLKATSFFYVIVAFLLGVSLMAADYSVTKGFDAMQEANTRYLQAREAATNMEAGSDYLTDRIRSFVFTGERQYLDDFFEEVNVTKRRDNALHDLEQLLPGDNTEAFESLAMALNLSNELLEREYLAMKLVLEASPDENLNVPESLSAISLTAEDQALSSQEKIEKAQSLVFDDFYMEYKSRIRENVNHCTNELIRSSSIGLDEASDRMAFLVRLETVLTVGLLLVVLLFVIFVTLQVRKPLTLMVDQMRSQQEVSPKGASELQFVTQTYNAILKENKAAREKLGHEASHDPLTGLFNRGAYEMMLKSVDTAHMALILVDVDRFKQVNDTYGHDVGDGILKQVAAVLKKSFRSVDVICRIGGDEFVVIMTRADSSMRELVYQKIRQANEFLQHPKNELPPVSLSVGVAFADRKNAKGDIFKDADTALYRVKEAGGSGCEIY